MALTPLLPGDPPTFERFRLQGRLGASASRAAFLAFDGLQAVVLTVLLPPASGDPGERARFAAEVASARRVRSAHAARLLDAAAEGAQQPWRVGEHIEGVDLATAVREHGPLPAHRVTALAATLAAALDDLAAAGVVHGALDPGDVVLAWDGPRLVDLGLGPSAAIEPAWLSPEQIAGRFPTAASDVHAWAATVVFAATGRVPWVGESPQVRAARVGREAPDLDGVPAGLLPLVAAALAPDPSARPTASALVGRLGAAPPMTPPPGSVPPAPTALLPGPPASPYPPEVTRLGAAGAFRVPGAPPAPPRRSKAPLVAAVVAAALLLVGGGAYALTHGGGSGTAIVSPSLAASSSSAPSVSPTPSPSPTVEASKSVAPTSEPPSPSPPPTTRAATRPPRPSPKPPAFRTRYDGGFPFIVPTDWVQINKGKDANDFITVDFAGASGSATLGYLMCPPEGCRDLPLDSYGRLLPKGVKNVKYDKGNSAITFVYTPPGSSRTEKGALKVLRDAGGQVVEIAFLDVFVPDVAVRDKMVQALVTAKPGLPNG